MDKQWLSNKWNGTNFVDPAFAEIEAKAKAAMTDSRLAMAAVARRRIDPDQATHLNAEVMAEMEVVARQYPGLARDAVLDIACGNVANRNRTPEQKQADARRWLNEREEVRAEGRKPLW